MPPEGWTSKRMLELPWGNIVAADNTETIVACRMLWITTIRRFPSPSRYCSRGAAIRNRSANSRYSTCLIFSRTKRVAPHLTDEHTPVETIETSNPPAILIGNCCNSVTSVGAARTEEYLCGTLRECGQRWRSQSNNAAAVLRRHQIKKLALRRAFLFGWGTRIRT